VLRIKNNAAVTMGNSASMIMGVSDFDASSAEIKRYSPVAEEITQSLDVSTYPDNNETGN
jgi:hypothetical protein